MAEPPNAAVFSNCVCCVYGKSAVIRSGFTVTLPSVVNMPLPRATNNAAPVLSPLELLRLTGPSTTSERECTMAVIVSCWSDTDCGAVSCMVKRSLVFSS